MAEAIENVIDPWLKTQFTTDMGRDSSYDTLKLATIDTGILRTPKDWEGWTLPALGYSNRNIVRTADQHIGGYRVNKQITYVLSFIAYGTEQVSIQSSRTLLTRAELLLKTLSTTTSLTGLTNDYGEVCNFISWFANSRTKEAGMSRLRKSIDPANAGKWFCAQDISIVFHTITGAS